MKQQLPREAASPVQGSTTHEGLSWGRTDRLRATVRGGKSGGSFKQKEPCRGVGVTVGRHFERQCCPRVPGLPGGPTAVPGAHGGSPRGPPACLF